ncbi:unnamed protein product [Musa acuminata subsp. malaccensis]|uniref:(wild Malaysian banana) hypothetical protein n=1 Tax=Musa acuminata subsp. malaccensis TaxID=214687 RepID=A0A804IX01_MUSAM|nr:PREDICTED: uncharacterized protein LOC103982568 [Musa acuminata subsp. malaccensis]CAG1844210.1 unnamed protein product [Musa acuminata subsp. malaccensis]
MAANGRALASGFGKRFVNQIWAARDPAERVAAVASLPSLSYSERRVHVSSSYDKNVEELEEARVPDHVIDAKSDKYWGPHPTTGVFGPADESGASVNGGGKAATAPVSGPSALDQTVWFRPLEDVDKPPNA